MSAITADTIREVSHVVTLIKRTADSKTFTAQSLLITGNSPTASLRPAVISSPRTRPRIVRKVLSFLRTHNCNIHYRRFHRVIALKIDLEFYFHKDIQFPFLHLYSFS